MTELICPSCGKDLKKVGIIVYTSMAYDTVFDEDGGFFRFTTKEREGYESYDYTACASCGEFVDEYLEGKGIEVREK